MLCRPLIISEAQELHPSITLLSPCKLYAGCHSLLLQELSRDLPIHKADLLDL